MRETKGIFESFVAQFGLQNNLKYFLKIVARIARSENFEVFGN